MDVKTTVDTCQCWKQNSGSFGRGTKYGSSSNVKDDRAIGYRLGLVSEIGILGCRRTGFISGMRDYAARSKHLEPSSIETRAPLILSRPSGKRISVDRTWGLASLKRARRN